MGHALPVWLILLFYQFSLLFSMDMNGPPVHHGTHPHGPNVFAGGSIALSRVSPSRGKQAEGGASPTQHKADFPFLFSQVWSRFLH